MIDENPEDELAKAILGETPVVPLRGEASEALVVCGANRTDSCLKGIDFEGDCLDA